MSTNHAEDSLDKRLLKRITELEKAVLALSTPQPVAGDILKILETGSVIFGPITLAPNDSTVISQQCITGPQPPSIWNYAVSLYVDVFDRQHVWPTLHDNTGVLTGGQDALMVSQWLDYEETNDAAGNRYFKIYVKNLDSVSHNIYYKMRGFLPKQTGTV